MDDEQVRTRATLSTTWRRGLIWGLCGALVLTWASALPAGFWEGALLVSVVLLVAFLPVALMRVDVHADRQRVRVALVPFARMTFCADDVVRVRAVDGRGGAGDGMGLRHLGPRRWGLLVGGDAVEIEIRSGRSWTISTPDPAAIVGVASSAADQR